MDVLIQNGLMNAVLASGIAIPILIASRIWSRPALFHALWIVVLLKLISPPIWIIDLGSMSRDRYSSSVFNDEDRSSTVQPQATVSPEFSRIRSGITANQGSISTVAFGAKGDELEANSVDSAQTVFLPGPLNENCFELIEAVGAEDPGVSPKTSSDSFVGGDRGCVRLFLNESFLNESVELLLCQVPNAVITGTFLSSSAGIPTSSELPQSKFSGGFESVNPDRVAETRADLRNADLLLDAKQVEPANLELRLQRGAVGWGRVLVNVADSIYISMQTHWINVAFCVWMAGSFLSLVYQWWWIAHFAQTFLRHAEKAPVPLQQQTFAISRRLGLKSCPEVWLLPAVVSPMLLVIGFQSRILFPKALYHRLDSNAVSTLLTHELAHYRRGDHWVRILEFIAVVLFWWHPIVWIARREIEEHEEQCVDALVVSTMPGAPRQYASALIATVDFLAESVVPSHVRPIVETPPLCSGLGRVRQLRRRLQLIMQGTPSPSLTGWGRACVMSVALLLPFSASWEQRNWSGSVSISPGINDSDLKGNLQEVGIKPDAHFESPDLAIHGAKDVFLIAPLPDEAIECPSPVNLDSASIPIEVLFVEEPEPLAICVPEPPKAAHPASA